MPKKYTTEIFEEKVKNIKDWFLELAEEYSSKNDEILIRCKNGHEFLANTKALVRSDKLKECPICQGINKERFCLYCGKKLEKDQKDFCSLSHAAIVNNSRYPKKVNSLKFNGLFCKNCGKELTNKQEYFCSNKCQKDYDYNEFVNNWKNKTIIIESKQVSNHIRRYLFEKYDNKCCKCGWNEKNSNTGLVPLEVHHKDGNYKNNDEENLELLCPNCHSLTPTFKSLNKGKGRSVC